MIAATGGIQKGERMKNFLWNNCLSPDAYRQQLATRCLLLWDRNEGVLSDYHNKSVSYYIHNNDFARLKFRFSCHDCLVAMFQVTLMCVYAALAKCVINKVLIAEYCTKFGFWH